MAVAGCTDQAHFTPLVQPGCLFLCLTVVHESQTINHLSGEDERLP